MRKAFEERCGEVLEMNDEEGAGAARTRVGGWSAQQLANEWRLLWAEHQRAAPRLRDLRAADE